MLILSGIVNMHLYPLTAATIASATPMFPEVGSTMVPPGFSNPLRSASSTTASAIRSLTLRPGLHASTFAQTVAPTPTVTWLSRMRGVLPTASRTLDKILDIGFSPKCQLCCEILDLQSSCPRAYRSRRFNVSRQTPRPPSPLYPIPQNEPHLSPESAPNPRPQVRDTGTICRSALLSLLQRYRDLFAVRRSS